ncbi:Transcriptional regulator SlyA [Baekduia alba]|uniref:MarR family winged helix-turn-helix transcriptional regulator n=1 Tax=Baekduia alba TaxID=2997333 RepID=UPI002340F031|nr:MarR family transcriptional regulator [Baekduia alba]WCB96403.1 Transcriptional regulator SlyA [Baekduia alba]
MGAPDQPPLGLDLALTAKATARAFDAALTAAGGSRSTWLVLLMLKTGGARNQREVADAVGIQGATLTHHLNAMESSGLVTRRRDPENRRVHVVELTEDGEVLFRRLRGAAATFDRRLRRGLDDDEATAFAATLARLRANVAEE